jgi:transposase-like protein
VERRKRYSRKFQRMAVERMRTCESVDELAKELGVTRRCLYKWRTKLEAVEPGEEAARPSTHALAHRKEILQLKRLLAEKAMEVDFLKGALQKVEVRRRRCSDSGEKASANRSEN